MGLWAVAHGVSKAPKSAKPLQFVFTLQKQHSLLSLFPKIEPLLGFVPPSHSS